SAFAVLGSSAFTLIQKETFAVFHSSALAVLDSSALDFFLSQTAKDARSSIEVTCSRLALACARRPLRFLKVPVQKSCPARFVCKLQILIGRKVGSSFRIHDSRPREENRYAVGVLESGPAVSRKHYNLLYRLLNFLGRLVNVIISRKSLPELATEIP